MVLERTNLRLGTITAWLKVIELNNFTEDRYVQLCRRPVSQFTVQHDKILFVPNGEGSNDLFICGLGLEKPQILKLDQPIARYRLTGTVLTVGLENGDIVFFESACELYRNYRHRSSITSIATHADLIVTTCYDELLVWRFCRTQLKLLTSVPLIYFEPGATCSLVDLGDAARPILLVSTSSKVYSFQIDQFLNTKPPFTLNPMPLELEQHHEMFMDPFQLVVFNFNQLMIGNFFHATHVL